jgi:hypothetical protein
MTEVLGDMLLKEVCELHNSMAVKTLIILCCYNLQVYQIGRWVFIESVWQIFVN